MVCAPDCCAAHIPFCKSGKCKRHSSLSRYSQLQPIKHPSHKSCDNPSTCSKRHLRPKLSQRNLKCMQYRLLGSTVIHLQPHTFTRSTTWLHAAKNCQQQRSTKLVHTANAQDSIKALVCRLQFTYMYKHNAVAARAPGGGNREHGQHSVLQAPPVYAGRPGSHATSK